MVGERPAHGCGMMGRISGVREGEAGHTRHRCSRGYRISPASFSIGTVRVIRYFTLIAAINLQIE